MSIAIDLSGKKALVTGVNSGIGLGIALRLLEAGCDVAGCGRSGPGHPGALAFLDAARHAGRDGLYRSCDLTHPGAAAAWVAAMAEALGGVDIVVSNAGRNIFAGAASCSEPEWAECLDLDLAAHWRVAQAARPHLEAAGGVVLVITSNHAFSTIPGCFPYNVAKAGLVAMVQAMALEWGPAIRTVGIAPGFIDTPGNDAWFAGFPDPAAERRRTEQSHPVGRIGTPEEIGALCAFLASPMAGFISGTTLLVDGGRSAVMQ
jgi:NAD(P)-dependent dehydrogenase (short-subunit alcohol dehydrogenase family)